DGDEPFPVRLRRPAAAVQVHRPRAGGAAQNQHQRRGPTRVESLRHLHGVAPGESGGVDGQVMSAGRERGGVSAASGGGQSGEGGEHRADLSLHTSGRRSMILLSSFRSDPLYRDLAMQIPLDYGRTGLPVTLPADRVVGPLAIRDAEPLADPAAALEAALAKPIGTGPLAELARGKKDACI